MAVKITTDCGGSTSALVNGVRYYTDGETLYREEGNGVLVVEGPMSEASDEIAAALDDLPAPWEVSL